MSFELILGPSAQRDSQPKRIKVDGTANGGFCVHCGSSVGELYWNGFYMSHLNRSEITGCRTGKVHDKTARTEDYFVDTFTKPRRKMKIKEVLSC